MRRLCAPRPRVIHPFRASDVHSPFGLNRLDDKCGRRVNSAATIAQKLIQIADPVDAIAVSFVRHPNDPIQRQTGGASKQTRTGGGQCAEGRAMEAVGERHDRNTAGVKSGELQRRLNRIRAGWTRELNQIIQFPRLQYDFIKPFDQMNLETLFRSRLDIIPFAARYFITASEIGFGLCPTLKAPAAQKKSIYFLPSMSTTYGPSLVVKTLSMDRE